MYVLTTIYHHISNTYVILKICGMDVINCKNCFKLILNLNFNFNYDELRTILLCFSTTNILKQLKEYFKVFLFGATNILTFCVNLKAVCLEN